MYLNRRAQKAEESLRPISSFYFNIFVELALAGRPEKGNVFYYVEARQQRFSPLLQQQYYITLSTAALYIQLTLSIHDEIILLPCAMFVSFMNSSINQSWDGWKKLQCGPCPISRIAARRKGKTFSMKKSHVLTKKLHIPSKNKFHGDYKKVETTSLECWQDRKIATWNLAEKRQFA